MNEPLLPPSATKSKRTLLRAAYVSAPLLSLLALTGCSAGEVGSPDELVGEQHAALQLSATATALSVNGGNTAANAVDGNTGTRWESAQGIDPEWITLDLGSTKSFDEVKLIWEGAYGKAYQIQTSNDNTNWTTIYSTTTGDGATDDLTGLNGSGRYVRMYGTQRGTQWGYSLYEMQVFSNGTSCQSNDLMTSTTLPMSASSVNGTNSAALANDNNTGTRWESASSDPQYLQVDLGASMKVNRVYIDWETANAKDYHVDISADGSNWTTMVTKTGMAAFGNHRIDDLTGLSGTGRYVRVYGTARNTVYGYSIWELSVFGDTNASCGGASCTPTTCASLGATCGSPSDGCGGTLSCGTCGSGQTCNGSHQCVASCTPTTCAALGDNCGTVSDGCGGTLNCGTCSTGQTCNGSNQCVASGGGSCASNNLTTSTSLAASASTANGGNSAAAAFDNNTGSRWESVQGTAADPSWLKVDLGAVKAINRVTLDWETANAKNYTIDVSSDGTNWTTIATKTNMATGNHRIDDLTGLSGTGRYVRMNGTARNTAYGYSIYEMDVYGDDNSSCSGGGGGGGSTGSCGGVDCGIGQNCVNSVCVTGNNSPSNYFDAGVTPDYGFDFGSNVKVYTPSTPATTIQADITNAYNAQLTNQFGSQRYAFLFTPGTYTTNIDIGFYEHFAGVGDLPDTVAQSGYLHSDATWLADSNGNYTNATQNFWRSIENFHNTATVNVRWAVSQAAPMRRMHTDKAVELSQSYGWASGGFIADSQLSDYALYQSQQQFLTRNSYLANTDQAGSWNMVYVGNTGAVPAQNFPTGHNTTVGTTPVVREKPFLVLARDGKWKVFVPSVRTNSSGPSWTGGTEAGSYLPITSFYVAKAGVDTAATMNAALASGKNLLVTPGVYHINAPIAVTNANTVVLGIGMATIIPDGGVKAMTVADVDGVKLAGLLFDAGTTNSPVLLEVGPSGSSASHASNPTSISDIFCRIGGTTAVGIADACVIINSNDVIGDHAWLWRADHSQNAGQTGWTVNPSKNGIIVNGNNVTFYGLFVEHFQQYETLWNGNNGRVYFYQNEMPYDPPNQASYMNGSLNGWASYKVADGVTNHEAWGLGMYAVFSNTIHLSRAIEANDAATGVKFHDMCSLSLTTTGTVDNLINNTGGAANPVDFNTYAKLGNWH